MAVLWTAVVFFLGAVNIHFFWTAQHTTAPHMIDGVNTTSLQSGLHVDDDQIMSKPEACRVGVNHSTPQLTSNARFLSTMSQFASSWSSFIHPVDIFGTSKFSVVTVNPVELTGPSTQSVPASAWATAADVQYCLIARRYIRFYLDFWYWIDLTLWSVAPFITIIHRLRLRHFFLFSSFFQFSCSVFFMAFTSFTTCLFGPLRTSALSNLSFISSNSWFLVWSFFPV